MGFPIVNLYIDTHIITEMCHGILMIMEKTPGGRFLNHEKGFKESRIQEFK
jgi:hypothetical protein